MDGAQALIGSLVGAGVDVCFMNPGTSEMHFVSALDFVPEMRGVLTLFEGQRASRMLDLSGPTPDFTEISTGLGVPATRVTTAEGIDQALRRAYAEPGPHLIEAMVPPVVPRPPGRPGNQ